MAGLIDHFGWGGALSPKDRICGTTEVPPAGVGLRASLHTVHRYGILGSLG